MTQSRVAEYSSSMDRMARLRSEAERRADHGSVPWSDVKAMLRDVGMRPTRQRLSLAWILFSKGDRHITAEMLYEEAIKSKVPVSLATVYNTLHQFTESGLLREVAVDGSRTYFDTNVCDHHHFFVEGENAVLDIPSTDIIIGKMMTVPDGYEISRIDVVVRLTRKD
jgi:Fur family transcriptional regulator, iron response regulator